MEYMRSPLLYRGSSVVSRSMRRDTLAYRDELLHGLVGIACALHVLGLIDEQVGAGAVIGDELVGGELGSVDLCQCLPCLFHQAGRGEDVRQIQAALVQPCSIAHLLCQADALAHVGVGRVVLIGRIFLIQPSHDPISAKHGGLGGQVGLHLREPCFFFGNDVRLNGNQAVQSCKRPFGLANERHGGHQHGHCQPPPDYYPVHHTHCQSFMNSE